MRKKGMERNFGTRVKKIFVINKCKSRILAFPEQYMAYADGFIQNLRNARSWLLRRYPCTLPYLDC